MRQILLITALIYLVISPAGVLAHGTDYRVTENDTVVATEFFYSDKTPMSYAEVLVFSPENDKVEFQNGRTDQNGRFAFFAETPGDWRVEVNDGMGHAVHATVAVSPWEPEKNISGEILRTGENDAPRKTATEKKTSLMGDASTGVKLFLGLSILLNLFLGLYVWKRKK